MIERHPAAKRMHEYRRDLPTGLGSSFVVHACLIAFAFSIITVAVVRQTPVAERVKSQVITIETLVRTPQAAQVPQPVQHRVVEITHPQPVPQVVHLTVAQTSHQVAKSQHMKLARFVEQTRTVSAPKVYTASAPAAASTTQTTLATSNGAPAGTTNGNNTGVNGNGSGDSGYDKPLSTGGGGAWSEHPSSGPLGPIGHGDSCSPSRGGYFNGH